MRFTTLVTRTLFLLFFSFICGSLVVPAAAQGERADAPEAGERLLDASRAVARSEELEWPSNFEGRVEFWRHIFTKYGEMQRVFHHRERPEIIYSILDFSEYEANYKGKKLQRLKEKAAEAEIKRIRTALQNLGKGKPASNDFEKRIVKLFTRFHKATPAAYRYAADKKLVRYQRGIKERFREGIVRSGRYLYAIEQIFAKEGLPLGLARLPLVESSFDYKAYSSVGAAGIWQFIRSTGRRYMRVNSAIDERRDPIIASRAAAKYLKNSYKQLKRWPLAVTSYNHGLAGVKRAVAQTGSKDLSDIVLNYKGKRFGFASGNFYASFLAAVEVERNANLYFPGIQREKPWRFDEVQLGKRTSFSELLRLSGTSKDELQRLNLAFRSSILKGRSRIPAGSVVKVPYGRGQRVLAGIAKSKPIQITSTIQRSSTSNRRVSSTNYRVRRGDTIGGIAQKYNISKQELMDFNKISNPRKLYAGKQIRIPNSDGQVSSSRRQAKSSASRSKEYTVKSGDSLSVIASKFGVSSAAIRRANSIKGSKIIAGKKLKIPASSAKAPRSSGPKSYTVKPGDNLSKIAKKVGLSVSSLKKLNPNANRLIFPGQKLVLE